MGRVPGIALIPLIALEVRPVVTLLRRSQSLGVALVVLAMTATVAFAAAAGPGGGDSSWNRGPLMADASESPDASEAPESEAPESQAPESQAPESEAPDGSSAPDAAGPQGAPTDNHGTLVSTAANMATPTGFPNHGAFVSCVAHMPQTTDPTTFDWTTVTPDSCGLVVNAVGTTDHGRGHHRGHNRPNHSGPTPD